MTLENIKIQLDSLCMPLSEMLDSLPRMTLERLGCLGKRLGEL